MINRNISNKRSKTILFKIYNKMLIMTILLFKIHSKKLFKIHCKKNIKYKTHLIMLVLREVKKRGVLQIIKRKDKNPMIII